MADKESKTEELLAIAKSKLDIHGIVELQNNPKLAESAATCSNPDSSHHWIYYKEQISDNTLFHETCHVKLNEIGFKTVELRMATKRDSFSDLSLKLVAEAYANRLSFVFFNDAAKEASECYSKAYGKPSNIKNAFCKGLDDILLFFGMAPSYIVAEKWNGNKDPQIVIRANFKLVLGRGKYLDSFDKMLRIMANLPLLQIQDDSILQFNASDLDRIFDCVVQLMQSLKSLNSPSAFKG
jgi:hypothetical protein